MLHWFRRLSRKSVQLPETDPRSALANKVWANRGMPQSAAKAVDGEARIDIWGGELWTLEERLEFPRSQRSSLMYAGVLCVVSGASGKVLEQLLGGLGFACAFQKELLSFGVLRMGQPEVCPRGGGASLMGRWPTNWLRCGLRQPLIEDPVASRQSACR